LVLLANIFGRSANLSASLAGLSALGLMWLHGEFGAPAAAFILSQRGGLLSAEQS
jgi:hypothetical protein